MFIGKRSPLGTFSLQKSEIFVSRDTTLRSYGVKEVLAPAFSINIWPLCGRDIKYDLLREL
jgi:hypothetical protein